MQYCIGRDVLYSTNRSTCDEAAKGKLYDNQENSCLKLQFDVLQDWQNIFRTFIISVQLRKQESFEIINAILHNLTKAKKYQGKNNTAGKITNFKIYNSNRT